MLSQDYINVLEQHASSILCVAVFRATRLWNHVQDGGRTFLWNIAVRHTVITLSIWMYKCNRMLTKTSIKYCISCHKKPIFPSDKSPPKSRCASTVEGQIVIKSTNTLLITHCILWLITPYKTWNMVHAPFLFMCQCIANTHTKT